nr:enoyl-CoA hydratase-related protein [Rhodococcus sp. 14C212]
MVGGVATLSFERAERSNAIDEAFVDELSERVSQIVSWGDRVGALLICARGRRFSVGGDLKFLDSVPDEVRRDVIVSMTARFHAALKALNSLDAPIVVAARGAVAGGAIGFIAVADLVIVSATATFSTGNITNGLPLDGGSSWLLPRYVGPRRAAEMYYEGRVVTAREAVDWGLATRMVDDAELDQDAMALARRLAGSRGRAVGETRRLLRGSFDMDLEGQLDLEAEAMTRSVTGSIVPGGFVIGHDRAEPKDKSGVFSNGLAEASGSP